MKWLTDILGGKAVEEVGTAIDKLSTSGEEKAAAKNEISKIVLTALNNLNNAQKEVLVTELKGNPLQRLWRPIVMLSFAFIVVFHHFIYPLVLAFNPELPELEILSGDFWVLLEIGIGGYVIGRSVEKVSENVTRNVDLSLLRKKDRRKAMKDQNLTDDGED